jgi:uncharacterized membrane protein YqiK
LVAEAATAAAEAEAEALRLAEEAERQRREELARQEALRLKQLQEQVKLSSYHCAVFFCVQGCVCVFGE